MSKFAFGLDDGKEIADCAGYLLSYYYSVIPVTPIFRYWKYFHFLPGVKKLDKSKETIYNVISKIIDKKTSFGVNEDDKDLLSILLRQEEANTISKDVLVDNMRFMLAAGDTTPKGSLSLMYYLAVNPDIQQKVIQEIKDHITDVQNYTKKDLDQLEYIYRVVKEILRIAPPVRAPVPRKNREEEKFGDYVIPAGSEICYTIYALHHNEQVWKNPDIFDPDRFLPENLEKQHDIGFMPFMLGSRNCLGQHVALLEIKTFVVEIFGRYSVTIADPTYKLKWKPSWVVAPQSVPFSFKKL